MGFPNLSTVKAFIEIVSRDGIESVMDELLTKEVKKEYDPLFSYLKKIVTDMLEDNLTEECNYYTSGFINCFQIFRMQIEGESMSLDDLEIQLQNIIAWSEYLEEEVIQLRNQIQEKSNNT